MHSNAECNAQGQLVSVVSPRGGGLDELDLVSVGDALRSTHTQSQRGQLTGINENEVREHYTPIPRMAASPTHTRVRVVDNGQLNAVTHCA